MVQRHSDVQQRSPGFQSQSPKRDPEPEYKNKNETDEEGQKRQGIASLCRGRQKQVTMASFYR
ncbi:hypothetical protein GYMLUDRAFT_70185 [Collybiopsis luxurians FD-317 M1]|nr:hypothetical protein GYMLUDRAFT_70185 [Collybiopsis luxurians FD-317 M1]